MSTVQIYYKEKVKPAMTRLLHTAKEIVLSPFRLLRFICIVLGGTTLLVSVGIGYYIWFFFASMPDIESKSFRDFKLDATIRVHKKFKTKKERGKFFWTILPKVNREFLYSIVMSEDSTFFEHNGVNFNAMIDSLARNIRKRKYERGASTITQQVVKNVYLTNEKTMIRKVKEILIARELESRFSKNEILEVYLNIAEFGPKVYGVGMAGFHFYKKHAKNVKAGEGAYLSLMLPSPKRNYFSIHTNKYISPKNKKKMNRILRDMRFLEFLSPQQYNQRRKYSFLKRLHRN